MVVLYICRSGWKSFGNPDFFYTAYTGVSIYNVIAFLKHGKSPPLSGVFRYGYSV
jgi:hypothetical protein